MKQLAGYSVNLKANQKYSLQSKLPSDPQGLRIWPSNSGRDIVHCECFSLHFDESADVSDTSCISITSTTLFGVPPGAATVSLTWPGDELEEMTGARKSGCLC